MSEQQKADGCFCHGAGPRVSNLFRDCWSQATKDHFHNSRVEFWKGVRSLIDERIERMSRQERKGTTVPVE
ncbi:MAG TPA: hypothetical protein VL285_15480 [Bryobacteraceae bacterium]|jgi:hypothetical protein|nr:hypothetical protein [Bryobacteraceae bacterium]